MTLFSSLARFPARSSAVFLALVLGLWLGVSASWADERILSYDAAVDIARDGTLTVTEEITVRSEQRQILRGIFRDIPLVFEANDGHRARNGFELLAVNRDGAPEPHKVNSSADGVRIYIGEENTILAPGVHRYTLVWKTTRQIRFFDAHDELFWNVTGNEWAFPIDRAAALVTLPDGVSAERWTAFTGDYGETGGDWIARGEQGNHMVAFSTTQTLEPGEGLSIVVALPKGAVTPPDETQSLLWWLQDRAVDLVGGFVLLVVALYYSVAWLRVGRDPEPGVIYPRFEAPEGISPALASYIEDRGFSGSGWTALSAACLNLAVKGRMVLDETGGDLRLILRDEATEGPGPWVRGRAKGGEGAEALPRGENAIHRFVTTRGGAFEVSKANGPEVASLGQSFRAAIEGENRGRYFRTNTLYAVAGVALSVLSLGALLLVARPTEAEIGATIPVVMLGIFVSVFANAFGRRIARRGNLLARLANVFALFAGLAVILAAGGSLLLQALDVGSHLPVIAGLLVAVNVFFVLIMGAPTALGRQALDAIEGLKLYLKVAEEERMNMEGVPRMTPDHFEALLPYAVALGVEKPWAQAFQSWLETAMPAGQAAYQPTWMIGRTFDPHDVAGSLAGSASAMAGTFSSSIPAPKSSGSGFSGGSSGGGGGGGGGGGW
ncbi:DUF2207 domain-containing protein [Roseibium aestuarii]|uniref:DUF2207 domain-containing protein n=1 Tax=Roseibium aestuarii TaxID=2600299 RepID=A0ABW4JVT5_9HYPH|nr:DUF2207 domain-containing protein [Roseibium aestuarii]